jgi:glucose/arabinose dehydrogenase
MRQAARVQHSFRLIILALLLAAGSLQGIRTVVTPEPAAATVAHEPTTAPACPPRLFARQQQAADADCQVQALDATTLPLGFSESIIFTNLEAPTAARFAPDGRVFVAEKSGVIKVFASLTATEPTIVVDLRSRVMDYFDRGLLSIALDPNFPAVPNIYAFYTYDAPIGGTAPTWGDNWDDPFANTTQGCVVSGRLSRFALNPDSTAGQEQVLIEAWCQQFPSHSVGDLEFGADGALYLSIGEGANYNGVDAGQYGVPTPNPCGDPVDWDNGIKEGGALRAQDHRTPGDPESVEGAVLRVDPANPADKRLVAYGFRNPFRFAPRPGTRELWVGNVGWQNWETIARIPDSTSGTPLNFGWPCYEGPGRQEAYATADLPICQALYADPGAVTAPYYAVQHRTPVVPGDGCGVNDSSITGLAFYGGGRYPAGYQGALFFGDYARGCIWMMGRGANGAPDPNAVALFAGGAATPVDLLVGPEGDLFYVDIYGGTIRRIRYNAPIADPRADRTDGAAPLTVNFNSGNSSTPIGGSLTYAWDLDGDGDYDDATTPTASRTYPAGRYTVGLRVTDSQGASDRKTIVITAGTPPAVAITTPSAAMTWQVGTTITFAGTASSEREGALPASAYTWTLVLYHCPAGPTCHTHTVQRFDGVTGGSFIAPDHEYPSSLELRLTARDAAGLTTTQSVRLYPQTANLNIVTEPAGQRVTVNASGEATPFSRTVIRGSANVLSPPALDPNGPLIFIGWRVDGVEIGWANPLTLTAPQDRFVTAIFGPRQRYSDVAPGDPAATAIAELGARGIIRGYGDGTFGPGDTIRRAQMAALIARAVDWSGERWPNPFPDQGTVDDELWQAVGTLNHYGVARGYPDGTYDPGNDVAQIQAIAFITRAMVAKGYWQQQPDDPYLYPEVTAESGHRLDLATYVHYTGAVPDCPFGQAFSGWDQAGSRAWFARALWQALDSYFR